MIRTNFDAWLQQLAAAGKGGSALTAVDLPPAVRGEKWECPYVMEGDWTGAVLLVTISSAPDGSVLVTATTSSASYDSGTGFTTWTVSIASGSGANSTGSLPADVDGDGVEAFPIAFYLTPSGGTKFLLLGGAFTLLGKV